MCIYSIKDLEHLSGIKAHTLRIWERRYNFIKPKRTLTNIRYYNDVDLKLVLNVALLKNNGFKISRIAQMREKEMSDEVLKITEKSLTHPEQVQALALSMIEMDEQRFEKIVATNILQLGFEKTMTKVIFPFFQRIGVFWQTGSINPGHEHFMTHLVRQKLMVAIDGQFQSEQKYASTFMLFLPEGEMHELSLLFSNFIIRARKHKVVYLGQNLPLTDLKEIYGAKKPDYLMTVATSVPGQDGIQAYIDKLAESFPDTTLMLAGWQIAGQDLRRPANAKFLNSLDELILFVEALNNNQVRQTS